MRPIGRIISSTRALWRYYAAVSGLTIVISLLALLQPLFSGWAIDEIRRGSAARINFVIGLALAIFVADLLSNVLNNINGYLGDRLSQRLSRLLSERYYRHLLTLPQTYFDNELTGRIISRLDRSITQISDFLNILSNNFLQFIFSTIFALAVIAYYSPSVAIMLFLLYPIYIIMTARSSGPWLAYQADMNRHRDMAAGRFAEVIGQIKVARSFSAERREWQFFSRHQREIVALGRPQSRLWHKNDVYRRLVLNFIFLAVFAYIFVAAAKGAYTPGQAVALILYAMQIRLPIFTISFLVDRTQRAVADSRDYFAALSVAPEPPEPPGRRRLIVKRGEVNFRDVSFAYDGSNQVLKGVSFVLKPGERSALVGESGEGKTTIVNLLLRLYQPSGGQILIDGQDTASVSRRSLRQAIGVVFQEPALFSGSIAENIAYGVPAASRRQIQEAAKAANAHDFISGFADGYDSQIGERGLKLSGGQKQRLAIARALLKNAPILVLDEATSNLDSRSELLIQEALERLMAGRTTLLIAHRLSTIRQADQIISLKDGRVAESGSPTKLAKANGIYGSLLRLQNGGLEGQTRAEKLKRFQLAL